MIGLPHYLLVSAALLGIGAYGALTRRNAIAVLMGVELMLNAANLNFLAFWRYLTPHAVEPQVFVLDERGALYRRSYPGAPPQTVLHRYAALFEALDQRYPGSGEAECAWLENAAEGWRLRAAGVTQPQEPAIQVRVYAEEVAGGPPSYTLVCNDREFSSLELGDQVFAEAARYIRGLRRSGEEYPFYVSDIDVPASVLGLTSSNLLHTACLLAYKRKLEQRLNG